MTRAGWLALVLISIVTGDLVRGVFGPGAAAVGGLLGS
jgi:hypothetical protein